MPLVKQFVCLCSSLSGPLSDSQQLNARLVDTIQQLAELSASCDRLFGELLTDIGAVAIRLNTLQCRVTTLANTTIVQLDHTTVVVPVGCLSPSDRRPGTVCRRRGSVSDYTSRLDRRLFTRPSRPRTIARLYDACVTSPVDVISQCDVYREDGLLGGALFSRSVVCLRQRVDQNLLNVDGVQVGRPLGLAGR
jgi:hypothetical protein